MRLVSGRPPESPPWQQRWRRSFCRVTTEQIRRRMEARPFQPFRVRMPNRRHADVPHPEFLHVFPGWRFASVVHADGTVKVMEVFLITSIQTLPRSARAGRRRKKARRG
jgi:hypothetical protein